MPGGVPGLSLSAVQEEPRDLLAPAALPIYNSLRLTCTGRFFITRWYRFHIGSTAAPPDSPGGREMNSSSFNETVKGMAPWREGVSPWIVLIQGVVLAAIGGFGVWRTVDTGIIITLALAAYLVLSAVWVIVQALRGQEYGLSVFNLLAAGGGLISGLGVLLAYFLVDSFDNLTAFGVFGIGLLIVGLLSLASSFIEGQNQGIAWGTLVRGLVQTLLGAYIFWVAASAPDAQAGLIWWLAIVLLTVGVLLVVWAVLLFVRKPQQAAG